MSSREDPAVRVGKIQMESGKFRWKRATDVVVPPLDGKPIAEYEVPQTRRQTLLASLAQQRHTGCIRTSNEKTESRGALIIFRGRCVGAIYTSKLMPDAQPTESSLRLVKTEISAPTARVFSYPVSEQVVLPLSTLFDGTVLERDASAPSRIYFDFAIGNAVQQKVTACISIGVPSNNPTCLTFIHKGILIGSFTLDDQKFVADIAVAHRLLDENPTIILYACVLEDPAAADQPDFGYSLV